MFVLPLSINTWCNVDKAPVLLLFVSETSTSVSVQVFQVLSIVDTDEVMLRQFKTLTEVKPAIKRH